MSRTIGNLDAQAITGHRSFNVVSSNPTDTATIDVPGVLTLRSSTAQITMNSDVNMSNKKITNLVLPTVDSDAATKEYVDNLANGFVAKSPVVAASVTNHPAALGGASQILTATANGALTLDTYVPVATDRVVIKDQADATQNGIYVVTDTGSVATPFVLTRAADANTNLELHGAFVFVANGALNVATSWVCVFQASGVIGTDPIIFDQVGASTAYTAGDGLLLNVTQFEVDKAFNFTGPSSWTGNHDFFGAEFVTNNSSAVRLTSNDAYLLHMNADNILDKKMDIVANNSGLGKATLSILADDTVEISSNDQLVLSTGTIVTKDTLQNVGMYGQSLVKEYQVFDNVTLQSNNPPSTALLTILGSSLPAKSSVMVTVSGVCNVAAPYQTDSIAFDRQAFFVVDALNVITQIDFDTLSLYKIPTNMMKVSMEVALGGASIIFNTSNPQARDQYWRLAVKLEIS